MSQSHIQEQIELIAKHEQEFLERRTRAECISDNIAGFIGSLAFVVLHLCIFAVWITWNSWPGTPHFDPRPYGLLQTMVAMEAILAASFILMRQARSSRRSDERDHLMLQILLLTEKELTALLGMERQIATEMGLTRTANSPEVRDLSQETSIDEVAQTIKENLPSE
ncbi:MAG: DUF1003 domain-containing protein [Acidobacteria bacterium]|nr:DUF1003 domain-containing protein [Acidobacteriota bacterium]